MNVSARLELNALNKQEIVGAFLWFQSTVLEMLAGDQVECPICGARLSRFLPHGKSSEASIRWKIIGAGTRPNGLCPACLAFDRERLVYLYLTHKTTIFSRPCRVLHVAPEIRLMRILSQQKDIDYISADLSGTDVMVQADVTALPFEDGYFDFVICNHVLEHVADDRTALKEIHRVLKTKGQAILQVPLSRQLPHTYEDPAMTTREQRLQAFGQHDHVRIYAADYLDRMKECGLNVCEYEPTREMDTELIARYGLIEEETVFVGVK